MNLRRPLLILLSGFALSPVFAQDKAASKAPAGSEELNKWSAGLNIGATLPWMDVNSRLLPLASTGKSPLAIGFGGNLNRSITNVFTIRGQANYLNYQGAKSWDGPAKERNELSQLALNAGVVNPTQGIYSTGRLVGGSLELVTNLSNIGLSSNYKNKPRKILYYAKTGVGLVWYQTRLKYLSNNERVFIGPSLDNQRIVSPVTSGYDVTITAGVGAKYKLNNQFDLGLESTLIASNGDNWDGIRMNFTTNDKLIFTTVALHYKFGKGGKGADALEWQNSTVELLDAIDDLNTRLDSLSQAFADEKAKRDSDGDGVPDVKDAEPFSPFGAKVDASGKAIDSDGDGVPDGLDKEPNTPAGELVNHEGRVIKVKQTEGSAKPVAGYATDVAYFPSVHFDVNSVAIRGLDAERLARVARAMKANPSLRITLVGHADATGGESYNLTLSEKRANAVKNFLVKHLQIDGGRIDVQSKGEGEQLSNSYNSINRRVDIIGR